MSSEPQRDIEKDLLAYKRRRHEQLGAPLEPHPATRKMLQGEVARTTNRPLLTSEEAAKNFVRSFVMSHQQPGFFTRYKQRILWGGGMFACLALVLAGLRNDPQQDARARAFGDKLPAPLQVSDPQTQAAQPQTAVAVNKPATEAEQLARDKKSAPAADAVRELAKLPSAPAGGFAPANPRGVTVASAPTPTMQRAVADRRDGATVAPPSAASGPASGERGAGAMAPTAGRTAAKEEALMRRMATVDADRKLAEKAEAGETAQLDKERKATQDRFAASTLEAKKAGEEVKLKLDDTLKRAQATTAAGLGGAVAPGAAPVAAPMPATAAMPLTRQLAYAAGGAGEAPVRLRFQQLDQRVLYRQNFNSPPLPAVLKDFAFERTGDRVRIVDADGSTYEGSVLPATEVDVRAKQVRVLDEAKALKDTAVKQAQPAGTPAADAEVAYRFFASGVNRKLNQSVEFRGEWLPAVPAQAAPETPALQATSFGAVRLEAQTAEKKKSALTNALADNPAPTQAYLFLRQQKESSQGRISGRAVVGGRNEFDIKAVAK